MKDSRICTPLLVAVVAAMFTCGGNCSISVVPGTSRNNHMTAVRDWCGNFTGHVNAVVQKFGSVSFNRSDSLMKTGITEAIRLAYDRRDLKIFSHLFVEVTPDTSTPLGKEVEQCMKTNKAMVDGLAMGFRLTELYLNGSIPLLPNISTTSTAKLRYEDMAGDVGFLKAQLRDLAVMLGKVYIADILNPIRV